MLMAASAVEILKALSDESRLRILGVLRREPLSVNELLDVLNMGQSRVSRHLKILADAGILERRRAGSRVYYGYSSNLPQNSLLNGILSALGLDEKNQNDLLDNLPGDSESDFQRLHEVLSARKEVSLHHFQEFGAEQDRLQAGLVDSPYYRRKILELLPEDTGLTADLGCGGGELADLLGNQVQSLIGVDQSPNLLERARSIFPAGDFRIGAMEHLPLRDGEADTVVLSMVLHHIPEPLSALLEASRVLSPGGTLIIADLLKHEEEVMSSRFADFWLGFEQEQLETLLVEAGFTLELDESGSGEGKLNCLFLRARKGKGAARRKLKTVAGGSSKAPIS